MLLAFGATGGHRWISTYVAVGSGPGLVVATNLGSPSRRTDWLREELKFTGERERLLIHAARPSVEATAPFEVFAMKSDSGSTTSLWMATAVRAHFMPTRCWMAPEMPSAT